MDRRQAVIGECSHGCLNPRRQPLCVVPSRRGVFLYQQIIDMTVWGWLIFGQVPRAAGHWLEMHAR